MATKNLGKVAFVFKGDYSSLTTYDKYDVAFDGESSFLSTIENNLGNPLSDTNYWKPLCKGNYLAISGKVSKTGAETIADLKTFTTIPQIPTTDPTLDAQVASKKYVDSKDAQIGADLNSVLDFKTEVILGKSVDASGNITNSSYYDISTMPIISRSTSINVYNAIYLDFFYYNSKATINSTTYLGTNASGVFLTGTKCVVVRFSKSSNASYTNTYFSQQYDYTDIVSLSKRLYPLSYYKYAFPDINKSIVLGVFEVGSMDGNGINTSATNRIRSALSTIEVEPSTNIKLTIPEGYSCSLRVGNAANQLKTFIGWQTNGGVFALPSGIIYMRLLIKKNDDSVITDVNVINGISLSYTSGFTIAKNEDYEYLADYDDIRNNLSQTNNYKVLYNTGDLTVSADHFYVDIPIPTGTKTVNYPVFLSGYYGSCFLDASMHVVSGYKSAVDNAKITLDIPSNAKTFRFCYFTDAYASANSKNIFDAVIFKINGFQELISESFNKTTSDVISDYISDAKIISGVELNIHKAFPTIEAGLTNVLHACWRQGTAHVSNDGTIYYSHSEDFGATWSTPVVAIQGGLLADTYYHDQRDCILYRMSNGKFIFVNNWYNFGTDGVAGSVNKTVAYIIDEINGVLDFVNKVAVELQYPTSVTSLQVGHGIAEKDNILYLTTYSVTTNKAYIFKSSDFGLTWSYTDTGISCAENCPVFVGNRLYIIARTLGSSASSPDYTDSIYYSKLYYSDDSGNTFNLAGTLNEFNHGMSAISLGESFVIAGRTADGTTVSVYKHNRQQVEHIILNARIGWDSDYADIKRLQNYFYVVYYKDANSILLRKVEANKLIGL